MRVPPARSTVDSTGRFTGTTWNGPGGIFGGRSPAALLQQFPWDRLQALRTELRSN